jgi:hypothetical protein
MKKLLSVLTLALFLVAVVSPVVAQDPPKDTKKTECPKKKEGCCAKSDSTKCAKHQKAGCCKGEKKACENKK